MIMVWFTQKKHNKQQKPRKDMVKKKRFYFGGVGGVWNHCWFCISRKAEMKSLNLGSFIILWGFFFVPYFWYYKSRVDLKNTYVWKPVSLPSSWLWVTPPYLISLMGNLWGKLTSFLLCQNCDHLGWNFFLGSPAFETICKKNFRQLRLSCQWKHKEETLLLPSGRPSPDPSVIRG